MCAPVSLDPAKFRREYPTFADPAVFADDVISRHFAAACDHISPRPGKRLNGESRERALYLMTAHLMNLEQDMLAGNPGGMVSGASVDKVSVSLTPPPVKSQFQHWLCLTSYGQQLLALLKSKTAVGLYVGGLPAERAGFRKAGGVFVSRKGTS